MGEKIYNVMWKTNVIMFDVMIKDTEKRMHVTRYFVLCVWLLGYGSAKQATQFQSCRAVSAAYHFN